VHHWRLGFVTVTAVVAAAGAVLLPSAVPASAATTWTVAPAPPIGANSALHAIAAIPGTGDAWAVGGSGDPPNGNPLYEIPLIYSWDGTSWTQASVPSSAGFVADLTAVSASSASDAWAVGYTTPDLVSATPDALHWNGSAWSTVGSASAAVLSGSQLLGVTDISPTDAYAVSYNPVESLSQVIHWNGSTWSAVAIPQPGTTTTAPYDLGVVTYLSAISADGPDDVWAVGGYFPHGSSVFKPYSLHFNGTTWSIATLPQVSGASSATQYEFGSVVANSPTDVWAVGESYLSGVSFPTASNSTSSTLIEHWNGTAWSVVPSPSPASHPFLTGVATSNPANDISAVGYDTPAGASSPQTLVLSWDGTAWSTVTSPAASESGILGGVAAIAGGALAVGSSISGDTQTPLVLQGS
jgi:hypothetical protein